LPADTKPSDYIVSLEITARKPGAPCECSGKTRYTALMAELAAIAASVASNCEFCLTYHTEHARKLGATSQEMAAAVATGRSIKEKPARAILKLAGRLLDTLPK
jgi:AhpD family alkylhydroperoxidase